jgi:uncharacterized protein
MVMSSEFLQLIGISNSFVFIALFLAALVGGAVRGFTGFGFAMVFVPIASIFVGPTVAVPLIWLMDIPFAVPIAAKSYRHARWGEVIPLLIGASCLLPLGIYLLTVLDPTLTRWMIAIAIMLSVLALATGWRYRGTPGVPLSLSVGGLSGLASGLAQLGGMPLAVFWLAAQQNDAQQTKHNLNAYFGVVPIVSGFLMWRSGLLTFEIVKTALALCIPYGIGLLIGMWIFRFASEQTFRRVAYAVIACAAILALPVMDGLIGK